jgi:preprotein translocase subunit SecA
VSSTTPMFATSTLARPGQGLNWYPEKLERVEDALQVAVRRAYGKLQIRRLSFRSFAPTAHAIEQLSERLGTLDEVSFESEVHQVREVMRARGFERDALVPALAVAGAIVQKEFGFRLHREQYYCVWLLMHGVLAEMATGEGKSVTAGVAAALAAMAGLPVHVITTNDYLVERDAKSMKRLFDRFELSSGHASSALNDDERRCAYARDICYVSNKQIVFDYLRDRQLFGSRPSSVSSRVSALVTGRSVAPILRGLCFAIVDEADSVLIDDAITPLILSRQAEGNAEQAQSLTAISLAMRLTNGVDFTVDARARRITISEEGEYRVATMVSGLDGVWKNRRFHLELVRQALTAIHLFIRDREYIVRNDEVQLIDQSTGRVMPDRKLQHGLHQMVETKERCEISGQTETLASLSFQRFFRRYHSLCGMSGTVKEAQAELSKVYGVSVMPVPTHRPSARSARPPIICIDKAAHNAALIGEIGRCLHAGRPVLVGTRSLAESEQIAEAFKQAGIRHALLNARQDAREAQIVAKAGGAGVVTIATNMAGRGTDIPLEPAVRESGGLHVIVAELNDNKRIDRQLIGRSARQGDPGSYVCIICLEDELLHRYLPHWVIRLLSSSQSSGNAIWRRLCFLLCRFVQSRHERQLAIQRRHASQADDRINARLSFIHDKE